MANPKHKEAAKETPPAVPATPAVKAVQESIYTADDLIANHKAFGTSKEIVEIALRMAGKETATFAQAKTIIESFKNKEVK